MRCESSIVHQRFDELDSLRGFAATIVVLNHFFLATNSTGSKEDLLRTLVNPFQNGPTAVTLFFLISGFVLALPVWRANPQNYCVFIVRRICRIYLPYLFGLALSVLGASFFASRSIAGLSQWFYGTWTGPVDWRLVLKHILFVGPSYNAREFNTAFWTLIIEMRVSIIFPFFLLVLRRMSFTGMWLLAAVTWGIGIVSQPTVIKGFSAFEILGWTSMFITGSIIARAVFLQSSHISRLFALRSVAFLSLAAFLFTPYLKPYISLPLSGPVTGCLSVASGLATICAALYNRDLRSFLNMSFPRFLGRISYSLYLLHATVLYVIFHLLYGLLPKGVIFVLYLAISFLVAAISYKLIEKPAIDLGRRLTRERGILARLPEGIASLVLQRST